MASNADNEEKLAKSEQQAIFIRQIAFNIQLLDVDFLQQAAIDTMHQASRQESMAVLNPRHPQEKNELLRLQGQALQILVDYINKLKEVDEKKKELGQVLSMQDEIGKLFM